MSDSIITKRALAQALKDLMLQYPFQKISVGQICAACGMNRKSFYYHFRDKQELVYWIFHSEFSENIHLTPETSGWSLLLDICRYLYSERQFYRDILAMEGQNTLREYYKERVPRLLQQIASELFQDFDPKDLAFCLDFYTDAFYISTVRWLSAPETTPPEEHVEQLKRMLDITARIILDFRQEKPLPPS